MKFIIICLLLCTLQGCSLINDDLGLKDDNVFEEAAEEYIKEKTGISVEFTPESDTKKEVKNVP
jgi:hypothetical protein